MLCCAGITPIHRGSTVSTLVSGCRSPPITPSAKPGCPHPAHTSSSRTTYRLSQVHIATSVCLCVCLSVCLSVDKFWRYLETPTLICCLTVNYMYRLSQVHIATSVYLSVCRCLSVCGQVPEIDRHANIDLLPYSKLYVQPGSGTYIHELYVRHGPGTYSHVRVSVCLSVCGQVPEIET